MIKPEEWTNSTPVRDSSISKNQGTEANPKDPGTEEMLSRLIAATGSPHNLRPLVNGFCLGQYKSTLSSALGAVRDITFLKGDPRKLSPNVLGYVKEKAELCKPDNVFVCDGSAEESSQLFALMQTQGIVKPLFKYPNCWLALTDPIDVARVESKTFICTPERLETIPTPKEGITGTLGNWMSPRDISKALWQDRFPGCMKGRTMYVIPFSMGPIGSALSKIGIQLTDSPYVVASMAIMTHVSPKVFETLRDDMFVKCLHSVGQPLPMPKPAVNNWPCNPDKTMIAHIPRNNEIASYGSGYGGNSLLGKKCFALRLGSIMAKREGWLAEHMLIMGFTPPPKTTEQTTSQPPRRRYYLTAAFPSACGKTNLAMMQPTLPGCQVECIGDDIAWMRFQDSGDGTLRAINPENGFFGVAPGTSHKTNPNAMETITANTIFTNVAETSDGGFFWEGLEDEVPPGVSITSWKGQKNWTKELGIPAAHPNSRFCAPARQCPIIDSNWLNPQGVPIDAIVFGGRRPAGIPLVYAAFDWNHGVFMGSSLRSEATAAAEHKGKVIMHDPFAMRPFFGYNFGNYLKHWLSLGDPALHPKRKLPHIFHVNWFRKDPKTGKFLWPGFGENCRVIDWICRFCDGEDVAIKSPIGYIPKPGSINLAGLEGDGINYDALFSTPKEFWLEECRDISRYYQEQLPEDLPPEIADQLFKLENRIRGLP